MLTTIISINLTMTIMFSMMKHPLSMGAILLIQTTTISLMTIPLNQNSWFSYILFLIMIGGMLILFMYMTSIASNEKFKTNNKLLALMILIPITHLMIKNMSSPYLMNSETNKMNLITEPIMFMTKYMSIPLSLTLLFLMIYLLLTLIATVKITESKQGSIRQMN